MMEKAVGEKAYQNNEAYERTQMQKDMIIERLRALLEILAEPGRDHHKQSLYH